MRKARHREIQLTLAQGSCLTWAAASLRDLAQLRWVHRLRSPGLMFKPIQRSRSASGALWDKKPARSGAPPADEKLARSFLGTGVAASPETLTDTLGHWADLGDGVRRELGYQTTMDPLLRAEQMAEMEKANSWQAVVEATDPETLAKRISIAITTSTELDQELADLRTDPTLTVADVDAVRARKAHERQVEMKHNVNLTNDHASEPDHPDTRHWTDDNGELTNLDHALDRVETRTLAEVGEIRRSGAEDLFGDCGEGMIRIFDDAITGRAEHTGTESELAHHRAGGAPGLGQVTALDETVIHEIGHLVDDLDPTRFDDLRDAADWGDDTGLGPLDKMALRLGLKSDVVSGGRRYNASGDDTIVSHADGTIPEVGSDDHWYAQTSPSDQVAELYELVRNNPELAYRDFVLQPQLRTAMAESKRLLMDAEYAMAGGADPALFMDVMKARLESIDARSDQAALLAERDNLRAEAFDVQSEAEVEQRLAADDKIIAGFSGASPNPDRERLLTEYRARSARVFTPGQLDDLRTDYLSKLSHK